MAGLLRGGALALPWLAIALLAGLYVDEAVRVASVEAVPPAELVLYAAFQVVPLLLVVGPLGIAAAAVEQRVALGRLTAEVRRMVTWTPRVTMLLFAAFVSVFALDVFAEGRAFWETAVALLMHLVPTFVLLLAAALAWRWPWVGAAALLGWAGWYLATFCCAFGWTVYLALAGAPLALGLLFAFDWLLERPGPAAPGAA